MDETRGFRWKSAMFLVLVPVLAVACTTGGSTPSETGRTNSPTAAVETHSGSAAPGGISYTNPRRYQVAYRVAADNSGFDVDRFLLYQPEPVAWDGQTKVAVKGVSPSPSGSSTDALGNGIFSWDLSGTPPSGSNRLFEIRFTLTASETHSTLVPGDAEPYDRSSDTYRDYTKSERYIESDAARIEALGDRLADGATDPLILARIFYDYVIDHSTYELTGTGLHGAKALLDSGKGECGDYAALFVALSRASGIPARPIVGYWARSGLDQTHVWAEFYVQGHGWVPVDPTMGQRQAGQRDFYFGNMDNERVILNKGYNIELEPEAPDGFVAPFLQVPLWWYWGSGDSEAISIDRASWIVKSLD